MRTNKQARGEDAAVSWVQDGERQHAQMPNARRAVEMRFRRICGRTNQSGTAIPADLPVRWFTEWRGRTRAWHLPVELAPGRWWAGAGEPQGELLAGKSISSFASPQGPAIQRAQGGPRLTGFVFVPSGATAGGLQGTSARWQRQRCLMGRPGIDATRQYPEGGLRLEAGRPQ